VIQSFAISKAVRFQKLFDFKGDLMQWRLNRGYDFCKLG